MAGRVKSDPWAREVGFAQQICAHLGLSVARSGHAYEIATIKGDGVSLLLYPHKTTGTGTISVRARDNGSRNKPAARAALRALYQGEGLPEATRWQVSTFNTFYCKKLP
jgi:hypothetical protein